MTIAASLRLLCHPRVCVFVAALAALFVASNASAQECLLYVSWENLNRHIVGGVNTECGTCGGHTPPWGNWGVNSPWGTRIDGTQFMGWKFGDSVAPCSENISSLRPQWNSCTGGWSGNIPPSPDYWLNHHSATDQFSGTGGLFGGGTLVWGTQCPVDYNGDGRIDSGGCDPNFTQVTLSNAYMDLWELDPFSSDQFVGRFTYPSSCCTVSVSCDGYYCSGGVSVPIENDPHALGSAAVRLIVREAIWNDPNGCCSGGVNFCS